MNIPPGADTRPILTESMFQAICAFGGLTATPRQREAMTKWASYEGVPVWICNPMATTWPDGSGGVHRSTWSLGLDGVPAGAWNNANPPLGVGIYATEADGALATVNTIRQGNFVQIAAWIEADCITPQGSTRGALATNFRLWGTMGMADAIVAGWQPSDTPAPVPTDPLEDILLALFAGSEQKGDRASKLSYARDRVAEIVSGTKPSLVEIGGSALALAAASSPSVALLLGGDIARILTQAGAAAQQAVAARGNQ